METIADRLERAQQKLEQACQEANRAPNTVQLLAVSKTKPVSDIVLAYEAGQRMFGENYVQEGVEKVQALAAYKDIQWHFIGPLQSNKTKLVAEHFDWMQSIDRLKIAQRLNTQRPFYKAPLNICIQVNIDNEGTKSGVTADQVLPLAAQVSELENLQLRGLMAIPFAAKNNDTLLSSFSKMQQLFNQLKSRYSNIDTLSMGMSGDTAAAIAQGSTMVRLGTAIFGARDYTRVASRG